MVCVHVCVLLNGWKKWKQVLSLCVKLFLCIKQDTVGLETQIYLQNTQPKQSEPLNLPFCTRTHAKDILEVDLGAGVRVIRRQTEIKSWNLLWLLSVLTLIDGRFVLCMALYILRKPLVELLMGIKQCRHDKVQQSPQLQRSSKEHVDQLKLIRNLNIMQTILSDLIKRCNVFLWHGKKSFLFTRDKKPDTENFSNRGKGKTKRGVFLSQELRMTESQQSSVTCHPNDSNMHTFSFLKLIPQLLPSDLPKHSPKTYICTKEQQASQQLIITWIDCSCEQNSSLDSLQLTSAIVFWIGVPVSKSRFRHWNCNRIFQRTLTNKNV